MQDGKNAQDRKIPKIDKCAGWNKPAEVEIIKKYCNEKHFSRKISK